MNMDCEADKFEESDGRSLFEAIPRGLAREYSSLLARIKTIYGGQITARDFLGISEVDFADQRGVGSLYVARLRQLQTRIIRDRGTLSESSPKPLDSDFDAWEIPLNSVDEEYSALVAQSSWSFLPILIFKIHAVEGILNGFNNVIEL